MSDTSTTSTTSTSQYMIRLYPDKCSLARGVLKYSSTWNVEGTQYCTRLPGTVQGLYSEYRYSYLSTR